MLPILRSSVRAHILPLIALFSLASTSRAQDATLANPFSLHNGDRVVMLGDGLIEQEQYSAWVELMLTTNFSDQDVTFRNLGWSGDTPAGDSRFGLSLLQAGREPDNEGWKQLQQQLELTKPTVLILGYGMASALEADDTSEQDFRDQFERLLARAKQISPNVRFVFLTPIANLEANGPQVNQFAKIIRELAEQEAAPFVDCTEVARQTENRKDPIHLNDVGYRALAKHIQDSLGLPASLWQSSSQSEALRQTILRKNRWWFHRSRPANMAYVFGFRKHEQGQNAVEIPEFDELIAKEEKLIARLRDLQPQELPVSRPQLASKFAEFTEQPVPEFTVDDRLEIQLFAQNPDLNKPIHMNFDPQGRLWIASSEAYPMIEVGQAEPDKIIVLEDTNADGRADKSTVFAEGLLIPTGIVPGDGGVYVAQSTDLLFLKDNDGDGRADEKRRVLSGFGTEDTHHNLHTLHWGPDGRLYMNQSVYTRTDAETPWEVARLKAGGGFRYDTSTMTMQTFFRGLWNSWGHQFDAFGQSFLTDGAGFAGIAYSFPGATFNPSPKSRRQLDLISPGSWPKFASLEILDSPTFPAEWQGSIITCDFRANRVTRFSLTEQDSGFVTKQEPDLVRTSAVTFRPIDVKLGPDGALYIADWSNPIINHGEVDFRDPRRDRWHGRIWRVTCKDAPPKPTIDFTKETSVALLKRMISQDRYDIQQARRVLVERGSQSESVVTAWIEQQIDEQLLLQGLWLQQGLKMDTAPLTKRLLAAQDPRVRAAATRVLGQETSSLVPSKSTGSRSSAPEAIELLCTMIDDPHPRVRLEAVCGLKNFPESDQAAAGILQVLEHPMDRFLQHAAGIAVDEMPATFMALLRTRSDKLTDQQLEWTLTNLPANLAREFLKKHLVSQGLAANGKGPWIDLIAKAGGPEELDLLFSHVLAGKLDRKTTHRSLTALSSAQRLRKQRPLKDLQKLGSLLASDDALHQVAAISLAGQWKLRGQVPLLKRLLEDSSLSERTRVTILVALRNIGSPEAATTLESIARTADSNLRTQAVANLAALDADRAEPLTLLALKSCESEEQALQTWRAVLNNSRELGKRLAGQLQQAELSESVLRAGLRATNDGGRKEEELKERIQQILGASSEPQMTAERISQLLSKVNQGDPSRGELVYRRHELACTTCHAIGGVGGRVGPDMTSLGASAPVDYLVESLFDPNAKIKEGYHSVTVLTEDDRLVTGIEIESTEEELVIRDAQNKLVRIPKADVAAKRPGNSLMPVGVVDRLSMNDQADLVSFLSQLGKPGKFDASQGGVARAYQVFAGTHRQEQQGLEKIINGELQGWLPLQSLVNGDVPRETLQELTKPPSNISLVNVYLKTELEVGQSSEVQLKTPSPAAMWIDGQVIGEGQTDFTTNLKSGKHEVIVRLDARDLPELFRLESQEAAFATQLE